MRLPIRSSRDGFGINMTPMIDVVFLLIIFFLVSSHLARQEVQLELDLPSAKSGRQADLENRTRVTVNVLPDGQLALGAKLVDPDELTRRLRVEVEKTGPNLELRIRSDRRVPYRRIEPVMLSCVRAGIWNLTFAVVRQEE